MIRKLKNAAKASLSTAFRVGQRLGVDVLPRHFYSEIPDIGRLREATHWREPFSLVAVEGADDLDGQAAWLKACVDEPTQDAIKSRDLHAEACERNGEVGYGPIEADCLYAVVRGRRPERIVQIGCGVSTALCQMAAEDAGYSPRITCIEPYPTEFLKREAARGAIELVEKPVELLPLDYLSDLSAGDLFFVDSTHTLGPAGEVTRIICEMLPRLPNDVLVHFHDIWLPHDYSPRVLDGELFFWHETALLMAYLSGNARCRIAASLSQLHHARPEALTALFPDFAPMPMDRGVSQGEGDYPSAIYLLTHG